jgi:hypothetical protein
LAFAVNPPPGDTTGTWARTWQKAYKKIDDIARSHSPVPGVLGLVGSNIEYPLLDAGGQLNPATSVIPRGTGYRWGWQRAQQIGKSMRDLLTEAYGYAKDPDFYMLQLYHPNSWDLLSNITNLTSGYTPNGIQLPADKIFVVEFATSSSMDGAYGSPLPYTVGFGDSNTPTTTVLGQAQWIRNTLCAFHSAGIRKTAYFAMYDPYYFWTSEPWLLYGLDLAWNGFWGLAYDWEPFGDKPAWPVLRDYHLTGTITCPTQQTAALPVLSLSSSAMNYTVGQPVRLYWTAGDVSALAINRTHGPSYSCNPAQSNPLLSMTSPEGSCGYSETTPFQSIGLQTLTLTGTNASGQSQTASHYFDIRQNPWVSGMYSVPYSENIRAWDSVNVWGHAFSITGGNSLRFMRPGYPDIWFYNGDGHSFSDTSHYQISAALDGRLAPGTWTLEVRNGWSGTPSNPVAVIIQP